MEWMLLPYRRYAEFSGRSRRKEFWMFFLFQFLVSAAIGLVLGSPSYERYGTFIGFSTNFDGPGALAQNLFGLVSFVPNLAVSVRRLHDIDRSGWFLLLMLVPILGWFTLLVMFCLDGNRGFNRFGPDPKNPTDIDAFN